MQFEAVHKWCPQKVTPHPYPNLAEIYTRVHTTSHTTYAQRVCLLLGSDLIQGASIWILRHFTSQFALLLRRANRPFLTTMTARRPRFCMGRLAMTCQVEARIDSWNGAKFKDWHPGWDVWSSPLPTATSSLPARGSRQKKWLSIRARFLKKN